MTIKEKIKKQLPSLKFTIKKATGSLDGYFYLNSRDKFNDEEKKSIINVFISLNFLDVYNDPFSKYIGKEVNPFHGNDSILFRES